MTAESAFAALLERQTTAEQRDKLCRLREQFALSQNDAVWGLLAVVEDHCSSLLTRSTSSPGPQSPQRTLAPAWHFVALGMSLQTLVMATCLYVGARASASNPNSGMCTVLGSSATSSAVASVLAVPAGWLAFALALPILTWGVHLGWRVRTEEPAIGWTIVVAGTLTAAACVALLWGLA